LDLHTPIQTPHSLNLFTVVLINIQLNILCHVSSSGLEFGSLLLDFFFKYLRCIWRQFKAVRIPLANQYYYHVLTDDPDLSNYKIPIVNYQPRWQRLTRKQTNEFLTDNLRNKVNNTMQSDG